MSTRCKNITLIPSRTAHRSLVTLDVKSNWLCQCQKRLLNNNICQTPRLDKRIRVSESAIIAGLLYIIGVKTYVIISNSGIYCQYLGNLISHQALVASNVHVMDVPELMRVEVKTDIDYGMRTVP
jgi:hypothetical protein